ncbi:LysE/ArgO family amino acid transporter [Labrys wisconsinensis]|uniref:L-lysine exporter family protein LysE/ArgO n=1 Tax=Labrys wisconsinensis TaxID=425677 RepID=A0ABU0JQE4_9HYPH|nr:LysE family transporter [Labrys wisconsinensis]MDQ0475367.1 L-lysine exporter family protein LysE/ArgO [Labrys wisconsinensis]
MIFDGDVSGFQAGLALGVASMASVGPNNLMMMREGLVRGRMTFVASLVWASYVALIAASYLLAASIAGIAPSLRTILTWCGLAAISWFALQSLRAAAAAGRMEEQEEHGETGRSCLLRVLRVVWMNPLTYIELLLIPATLGQSFDATDARLQFVAALVLMATLCCYAYAFGGRLIASVLRHRASLRLFDFISGLILSAVALSMAASLLSEALP